MGGSFAFGDLTALQVHIPLPGHAGETEIPQIFGALPTLQQLNVVFYENTEWSSRFFQVLGSWAPMLTGLKTLRIKYTLWDYQVSWILNFFISIQYLYFSLKAKILNLLGQTQLLGPPAYPNSGTSKPLLSTRLNFSSR